MIGLTRTKRQDWSQDVDPADYDIIFRGSEALGNWAWGSLVTGSFSQGIPIREVPADEQVTYILDMTAADMVSLKGSEDTSVLVYDFTIGRGQTQRDLHNVAVPHGYVESEALFFYRSMRSAPQPLLQSGTIDLSGAFVASVGEVGNFPTRTEADAQEILGHLSAAVRSTVERAIESERLMLPIRGVHIRTSHDPENPEWKQVVFDIRVRTDRDRALDYWTRVSEAIDQFSDALSEADRAALAELVSVHVIWE